MNDKTKRKPADAVGKRRLGPSVERTLEKAEVLLRERPGGNIVFLHSSTMNITFSMKLFHEPSYQFTAVILPCWIF